MLTFRGVVYPAQCDAMGHMNIQHYVAAFDQAMWHLVHALGYDPGWQRSRGEGWADVRHEIDYERELAAGRLFSIKSTVSAIGRTSLTIDHAMLTADGDVAARMRMRSVYFDLAGRKSKVLPDNIRTQASAMMKSGPKPDAAPRGEAATMPRVRNRSFNGQTAARMIDC